MQTESTMSPGEATAGVADEHPMIRPARAMITIFAAVLIGAALIGGINRVTRRAAAPGDGAPMRIGSLTVHGPLKVRGELVVSGQIVVHGPVQARRIDRVSGDYLRAGERIEPRVVNGPMKVERGLKVDGDLRVDGPLSVAGEIKATKEITADGPLSERSAL
jgi:hypothetical protein